MKALALACYDLIGLVHQQKEVSDGHVHIDVYFHWLKKWTNQRLATQVKSNKSDRVADEEPKNRNRNELDARANIENCEALI